MQQAANRNPNAKEERKEERKQKKDEKAKKKVKEEPWLAQIKEEVLTQVRGDPEWLATVSPKTEEVLSDFCLQAL